MDQRTLQPTKARARILQRLPLHPLSADLRRGTAKKRLPLRRRYANRFLHHSFCSIRARQLKSRNRTQRRHRQRTIEPKTPWSLWPMRRGRMPNGSRGVLATRVGRRCGKALWCRVSPITTATGAATIDGAAAVATNGGAVTIDGVAAVNTSGGAATIAGAATVTTNDGAATIAGAAATKGVTSGQFARHSPSALCVRPEAAVGVSRELVLRYGSKV